MTDVGVGGFGLRIFDVGSDVGWFNVKWGDTLVDAPEGPMLWGLTEALGCDDFMIVGFRSDGKGTGVFP